MVPAKELVNETIVCSAMVRDGLERHPRFEMHFPLVHCSWMNQIEQWFSILQRKRLGVENFADLDAFAAKILSFIAQYNETVKPFNWTQRSFQKELDKVEAALKAAAKMGAQMPAPAPTTETAMPEAV